MPINKIQFQAGLSLSEFLEAFGTEDRCKKALLNARWPQGFVCQKCQGTRCSAFVREGQSLWQCSRCRKQTSLLSGTIFEHSRVPLVTWFQALYFLSQAKSNLSALALSKHLGVNYKTAWRMKHKLMQAMLERETPRRLEHVVQIDDAYLGGERNKGKRGRGSENKRPFVIAVSLDSNGHPRHVCADPVEGFTLTALREWSQRRLSPKTRVYSDGLLAFGAFAEQGHERTVVKAETSREACEHDEARWVNVALSNLKRSLDAVYHHFCFFKYADRYLAEFSWRFNRRFHLKALIPRLLVAGVHTSPWPERRLRERPVFGAAL
jgi:transposase-like protein